MGITFKGSPLAAALGPTLSDLHVIAGSGEQRPHLFRHWRASLAPFLGMVVTPVCDPDPYLFVLLADQEIAAQRPEQAKCLIDAAYAAYDQCSFTS
jgi:hypothetical protein